MVHETLHQSYDPAFFNLLSEVEDRHFWFAARNRIIAAQVQALMVHATADFRILEIGCGTGNVLRVLDQSCPDGTVIGMDLHVEGLNYARQRGLEALVQADLHHLPFGCRFDLIGLFDVLEHMPDDRQVLSGLWGRLRENGVLLLTVPAHPRLWSYFDEASHHCRRYRPDELVVMLAEIGFDVEYSTQYMASTLPLLWAGRRLSWLRNRGSRRGNAARSTHLTNQELRPIPVVNATLTQILAVEQRWLARGHTLPVGSSLLVVARRRV